MSALFPVMLDLRGWPCAVLGGGPMAEEKVRVLLAADAHLTVIAPELAPGLEPLAAEGRIAWIARAPQPEDLRRFRLAISALDHASNARFAEAAERERVLFNAADDPSHCRFLLPSVHRQGDLLIAVSTSGKCPALAVRLRERFQREFGPHYARFLELAASLRGRIARAIPDFRARRALWYRLADSTALELLRQGREDDARAAMEAIMSEAMKEQAA